jgi:hypothetical protein
MTRLLTALLLCMCSSAFAQVNYVLNPSLEDHTFCPTTYDEIKAANYWTGIDSNAIPNRTCAPEYLNACTPDSLFFQVAVPNNPSFWQYPRTGNGMAQVQMFYDESITPAPHNYFRDFLQGRLYKKLVANKSYCVSFHVCLEELSQYAIKDIGAYLDNGAIDTVPACGPPRNLFTPQIANTGGIISDTANWTKIEGSFIATGNEQFITIGNFRTKDSTTYVLLPLHRHNHTANRFSYTWYLVDDVSVIESDLPADAGPDTFVRYGDSVYIGRPHETGLECTWSIFGDTAIIGTGAGIWVKPTATTSYVVTQTLCGVVKKDTVKVEVSAAGVNSVNGRAQSYSLAPNPNDGHFQLMQDRRDEAPVKIRVYNTLGATLHTSLKHFTGNKAGLELDDIAPGMYSIVLEDSGGAVYTLRFIKK